MNERMESQRAAPAVVAVAFNRPASLKRLLDSLTKAHYPDGVTLVISIDGGGDLAVRELAERFDWPFGEKRVRVHSENLGLKEHVLSCGDLTAEYGTVIVLEDDLFVSSHFYTYAIDAQSFYREEPRVAGVSLYSHDYNETARLPFYPIDDGDVYFMQVAASSGQSWTREQWTLFRRWLASENDERFDVPGVPTNARLWPHTSWKKYFIKYLLETERYFVYPKLSLSTNFGDKGTHYGYRTTNFQTPISTRKAKFHFVAFDDSQAKYDAWCEISPSVLAAANPKLANISFCVDLFGVKDASENSTDFLLTRYKGGSPRATFGMELKPLEANILLDVPGFDFGLYPREAALRVRRHSFVDLRREHIYFFKDTTLTKLAKYWLAGALEKWPNFLVKLRLAITVPRLHRPKSPAACRHPVGQHGDALRGLPRKQASRK